MTLMDAIKNLGPAFPAAVLAAVCTHWLTRRRDRRFRMWDHRMDVYDEAIRSLRARSKTRREVTQRSQSLGVLDPNLEEKEYQLFGARMDMFASDEVLALQRASFAAMSRWMKEVEIARMPYAALPVDVSVRGPAGDMDDVDWNGVVQLCAEADDADGALVRRMLSEAKFKHERAWPSGAWTWIKSVWPRIRERQQDKAARRALDELSDLSGSHR
ncbi:hypothetical protein DY245_25355 [Streptomyces inhibens]|uniref:Uncharacterized protein n=1 Tax=Streptomyces inhibens TaxID=2293571 RepID=A0A371PZ43_STRIH|nr:hypothetical protein [Streptomyces inhibens]REK87689.1 hypothetical protein DY245_25355 [Streptomyces inhibens]